MSCCLTLMSFCNTFFDVMIISLISGVINSFFKYILRSRLASAARLQISSTLKWNWMTDIWSPVWLQGEEKNNSGGGLNALIFISGSNPSAGKRTIPPWQWSRQLMVIMLWGWGFNDRALACVFVCATSACQALPTVCLEIIEPLNKCFAKHTEIHKMGSTGHVMNSKRIVHSALHATETPTHVRNNTNCPCFYLSSLAK